MISRGWQLQDFGGSHDLWDVGVCTVGHRVPTAMTTISFLHAFVGTVVVTG